MVGSCGDCDGVANLDQPERAHERRTGQRAERHRSAVRSVRGDPPRRYAARRASNQRAAIRPDLVAGSGSPAHGRNQVSLPSGPGKRAAAIRTLVAATLNESALDETWSSVQRQGRTLAPLSAALFALVFVVSPLLVFTLGPFRVWPILLAGLLALTGAAAVSYFRAHRHLFPDLSYDHWTNALSMAVLPLSAMRSADKLTKDALSLYSGLVVAPRVCGSASRTYLRAELMDFERAGEESDLAGDAAQCVQWFREVLAVESDAALKRLAIDAFKPPVREDDCGSYCPRCHTQYLSTDARSCSACPEVQLVRFDSVAPPL